MDLADIPVVNLAVVLVAALRHVEVQHHDYPGDYRQDRSGVDENA